MSFYLVLIVSILSVGESGALLVGMRDASGPSPWMTGSNVAYAVSDIGFGLSILTAELSKHGDSWFTYAALGGLALSCGARVIQYKTPNAFCANEALFAMNLVKLGLLMGTITVKLIGH